MFHRGNEADIKRLIFKIGAELAAWVLGVAALASLGLWALLRALGAV
jgi:hypothetical protein